MHANGQEQGGGLRRNVQHFADDGIFFNGNSHVTDLLLSFALLYPALPQKTRGIVKKTRAVGFAEIILDFPTCPVYNEPNNYIAGEFV